MNLQYTLSKSYGNTSGSNEALTAGNLARNLADFDYDNGYNNFDVRHTFNFSVLYQVPYGRGRSKDATGVADLLLGGWDIGGIYNARSGVPINLLITRPDILYRDTATGNYFNNPAVGRVAVINTPGGGNSRNVRRPDLVPGVDPFINDNGLLFLNPAAFATPAPGHVRQPGAQFAARAELQPGGHGHLEALRRGAQLRVPCGDLQPVQHGELREPERDAAELDPDGGVDRSEQGAAGSGVHGRQRPAARSARSRPRSAARSASARRDRSSSRFSLNF